MAQGLNKYIPKLEWPSCRRVVIFEKAKTYDMSYIPIHLIWGEHPHKTLCEAKQYLDEKYGNTIMDATQEEFTIRLNQDNLHLLRSIPESIDNFKIHVDLTIRDKTNYD